MSLMNKLSQKLSSVTFCALDLETTGVNPAFDRIVEIGAVRFNLEGHRETFHTLVNPGVHIPYNVVRIHGITDELVAGAPYIEDIIENFGNFIKGATLIAHNPAFDLSFIDMVFRRHGVFPDNLRAFDTVRLARQFFPDLSDHKLSTLGFHLGIDCQNHRALDDALVCMFVFLEVLRRVGLDGNSDLSELMEIHGHKIGSRVKREQGNSRFFKDIVIGQRITIKYLDTDGNITIRNILPKEFVNFGKKKYIIAHCYLRDAERCFLENRIIGVE